MGTWPSSRSLHLRGINADRERFNAPYPPGYCHFGRFLDENYFKQITSEVLDEEVYRGRARKVWRMRGSREIIFSTAELGIQHWPMLGWLASQKKIGQPGRASAECRPICGIPTCSIRYRGPRASAPAEPAGLEVRRANQVVVSANEPAPSEKPRRQPQ